MAKGHENLIPLNKRTKEAQREIQSMGGKASCKKIRERKSMRETIDMMLDDEVPTKSGDTFTKMAIMINNLLKKACNGDLRAVELVAKIRGELVNKTDMNIESSQADLMIQVIDKRSRQTAEDGSNGDIHTK